MPLGGHFYTAANSIIENSAFEHGSLDIKDAQGVKMGEVQLAQGHNTIVFKDVHNMVVATVDQPQAYSDTELGSIQTAIDKTQIALDKIAADQPHIEAQVQPEASVLDSWQESQSKIGLVILAILKVSKEKSIKTELTKIIDVKPIENRLGLKAESEITASVPQEDKSESKFKPYRSITFGKYIEEHCSDVFRGHGRIFFADRFNEIDSNDWNKIKEAYGVDQEQIVLIASSAEIYTGSHGFLITKDDVIHAREIWCSPVSYHVTQIAGIKIARIMDDNQLNNQHIFIIKFAGIFGMRSIFKELNELFFQYRQT